MIRRLQNSEPLGHGPIQLMQGRDAYACAMAPVEKIAAAVVEADAQQLVDKVSTYIGNLSKISRGEDKYPDLVTTSTLALTAACVESKTRAEELLAERYNGRIPIRVTIGVR